MTALEPKQKAQLESWIEEVREHEHVGLKWAAVLYKIQLSEYWSATNATFAEFCEETFGYKKTMAYQLAACGKALENNKEEFQKNPPKSIRDVVRRRKFRHDGIEKFEYVGTEPELKEENKMPARQIPGTEVEMWQPPQPPEQPAPVTIIPAPKTVVPVTLYNEVHAICNYVKRIMSKEESLIHSEGFRHLVTMLNKLEGSLQMNLPGIFEQTGGDKPKARGTRQQVVAFCETLGLQETDGEWFFDKAEGCGWKNNGKAIVDWQATCRAWKTAFYFPSQKAAQRNNGNGSAPAKPKGWTIDREIARAKKEGLYD